MQITNSSTLFEWWPGTLIKLGIQCEREDNCVILKIESAEKNVSNVAISVHFAKVLPRYFIQDIRYAAHLHKQIGS